MIRFFMVFALSLLPLNAWAVDVERVVGASGVEAWLVQDHSNPIISMRFSFKGGAEMEPADKSGLANLASATMDEGAGPYDSQAFQGIVADQSITLRFSASLDTFSGQVQSLTEDFDQAMELTRLALTEPRFDDEPVARIKRQIVSGIRSDSEDPGKMAFDALFADFYPDHGYGRDADGTVETVEAITRDDLRAFVQDRLARANLIVGVVGDISPERLKQALDRTFGILPAEPKIKAATADVAPIASGRVDVIERDIPQSTIVFGHGGIKRDHPDYYAALVMNHILGGGSFTSRLYEEVREKRGLAYSVGSDIYPLDYSALLLGNAATENSRAAETLDVIRAEWARMAAGDVNADEVRDAKTYITGAFPLRFTSTSAIAQILVAMQLNDLGIDYLDIRNAYIGGVTLDDVKRVAAKYLKPDSLTVWSSGHPEGIVPSP